MSDEFEELQIVLTFLRKNSQNAYFPEEISHNVPLPVERIRAIIDNARLNQWVDVDHFGDDGNPCVQINPEGNRRLNQLSGRNDSFPTQNNITNNTIIGDGNILGDNNSINTNSTPSPTSNNYPKWNLIVAIVVGVFVITSIVWGFASYSPSVDESSTDEVEIPTSPELKQDENIVNPTSLPYRDVWETYKENRPYTLSWTDCGFGTNNDPEKTSWDFSMKPIMLNKNNEPALIPFNISYRFHFEILIDDKWRSLPEAPSQMSQKLTVEPEKNPWIQFVGITDAIDAAMEKNATKIQLVKSKSSFNPYVESIDDNLFDDFEPDRTDYVVTHFDYNQNSDTWQRNAPNDSLCANLFDR